MKTLSYIAIFLIGFCLRAEENHDSLVSARLIPQYLQVAASQEFYLALEISPKAGWHTYWRNAGDAGLATDTRLTLPEGFSILDTLWQIPKKFDFEGMANYGYSDKHFIYFKLSAPDFFRDSMVKISANVRWLACKDVCLPGESKLSLELKTGLAEEYNSAFNGILSDLPEIIETPFQTILKENHILIPIPESIDCSGEIMFIPYAEGLIDNGYRQELTIGKETKYLNVLLDKFRSETPSSIRGLLKNGKKGYEIQLVLSN